MGDRVQIFIAMVSYMAVVIGIGVYYVRIANKNSENFFIGGRSLGPWIAAMSAEASDMSGWLLMGLPGLAYWCGIADAGWTAIGLAVGTYANWLIVAKPLRKYSEVAGNAITIPDFFSNRFKEEKKTIMLISSLFILIFFAVYAGSCFVTCGKLFSGIFDINYQTAMILGALFVVIYTFLGGFLAESASDFLQACVMITALVIILITGTIATGGIDAVLSNIKSIPGFLDFFGVAQPILSNEGVQLLSTDGNPVFGEMQPFGLITILSAFAWGLGYFGMPQVLLRFIAIRKVDELTQSRRIAIIWVSIALSAAVLIGIIGRALFPAELLMASASENIFVIMSSFLLHPLFAGLVMAGILAATISSSDSYLLIAASAFSKNIYQGILHREANDKQVMRVSRITLLVVTLIGIIIALDESSIIFKVVSFAWAGFGATFGPLMLFSLFWKRINKIGALAGMLTGGCMVFIWKLLLKPLGGIFVIYELLPAFILSCIAIIVVSLLTAPPSQEILDEFELVKTYEC